MSRPIFNQRSSYRALVTVLVGAAVALAVLANHRRDDVQAVRDYLASNSFFSSSSSSTLSRLIDDNCSSNDGDDGGDSKGGYTCPVAQDLARLHERWGTYALEMSVAHAGSGARVRRVMKKLLGGEKVVIGVIGGSITFGHGLKDQEGELPWPFILRDDLHDAFPNSEIHLFSGAVPATGTDYFAACFNKHVPSNADLYIIEAAVNDLMITNYAGPSLSDTIDYTETIVRELLSHGPDTAVMMLSTWAVPHDYINGADQHAIVSEYYDVPRMSSRSFLYPYLIQHQSEIPEHYGGFDHGHHSLLGHQYMSDILLYNLLHQACQMETQSIVSGSLLSSQFDPFTLPPVRIRQRIASEPLPEMTAFCMSANVRLPDDTGELQPSHTEGFEEITYNDKNYWASETPGSRITFDNIEVHGGTVSIYYLRSHDNGLGNMLCWIDGNRNGATILRGLWGYVSIGSVGVVANGVSQGFHSLTCEVMNETDAPEGTHKVRIIAILASSQAMSRWSLGHALLEQVTHIVS